MEEPVGEARPAGVLGTVLARLRPQVTVTNVGIFTLVGSLALPEAMTYVLFYPFFRLVFGTLYPAYASYKAVRTKNVKEYVKWMMYWIVFALFTCAETFTDVFLSFWFPFYYEIKIILVLWLLSPATKGSSILYRKFVHPMLSRREQEIDEYIAKAKEQGYHTVLHLGSKGVNYATTVLMQTAIKNLSSVTSHRLVPVTYPNNQSTNSARSRTTSEPTQDLDVTDNGTANTRRFKSVEEIHQMSTEHEMEVDHGCNFSDDDPEYIQPSESKEVKPLAATKASRPVTRSRKSKKKVIRDEDSDE